MTGGVGPRNHVFLRRRARRAPPAAARNARPSEFYSHGGIRARGDRRPRPTASRHVVARCSVPWHEPIGRALSQMRVLSAPATSDRQIEGSGRCRARARSFAVVDARRATADRTAKTAPRSRALGPRRDAPRPGSTRARVRAMRASRERLARDPLSRRADAPPIISFARLRGATHGRARARAGPARATKRATRAAAAAHERSARRARR